MLSMDIGIDLGTASVLVYIKGRGVVLKEPSVVAYDRDTNEIREIGEEARKMLGRTPGNIVAIRPLRQGVISDYDITEKMLKYFILKVDPVKNMLFNPAESIDFNGNTGPFIQYTHARIRSIVRKAEEQGIHDQEPVAIASLNEKERAVIKSLHSMPGIIASAAENYSPAMIANYAYELAKNFNSFYQDTPILREEDTAVKTFRVQLCAVVAQAIKNTMHILGIDVPERM